MIQQARDLSGTCVVVGLRHSAAREALLQEIGLFGQQPAEQLEPEPGRCGLQEVLLVGGSERRDRTELVDPSTGSLTSSTMTGAAGSPSSALSARTRRRSAVRSRVCVGEVGVGASSGQSSTSASGCGSSASHVRTRIRRSPTAARTHRPSANCSASTIRATVPTWYARLAADLAPPFDQDHTELPSPSRQLWTSPGSGARTRAAGGRRSGTARLRAGTSGDRATVPQVTGLVPALELGPVNGPRGPELASERAFGIAHQSGPEILLDPQERGVTVGPSRCS